MMFEGKKMKYFLIMCMLSFLNFVFAENLVTKNGTIYKRFKILQVTDQGLVILHAHGARTIPLNELPDSLAQKYQKKVYEKQTALCARKKEATISKMLKESKIHYKDFRIIQVLPQGFLVEYISYIGRYENARMVNSGYGSSVVRPGGMRYTKSYTNRFALLLKSHYLPKHYKYLDNEEIRIGVPIYSVGAYTYKSVHNTRRTVEKITVDKNIARSYIIRKMSSQQNKKSSPLRHNH